MKVQLLDDDGKPFPRGTKALVGRHRWLEVEVSDRVKIHVPDPIRVRVRSDEWEVDLTVRPDPVDLTAGVQEVGPIRSLSDRNLPTDIIRALGLGGVLDDVVASQCLRYEKVGGHYVARPFRKPTASEVRKVRTPDRRLVDLAEVEKAAEVYRRAVADKRRDATMAVAEALNLTRRTAARRVDKARELELLGPVVGTKAGEAVPHAVTTGRKRQYGLRRMRP